MRRAALASLLLATAACVTTPAGAVSYFDISDAAADEDSGSLNFTVTRLSGLTQSASVRLTTRSGTALAGTDFVTKSQLLSFTPGQKTKTFTVTLVNDAAKEAIENLTVAMQPVSNARIWGDGSGFGRITDTHDVTEVSGTVCPDGSTTLPCPAPTSPPSLSIDDVTIAEGSPSIPVTIRKHGQLNSLPSTFTLYTINGTATAPGDYAQQQIVITLAPGETSRTVNIPLVDDIAPEPTEFMSVQIQAGANSRLYDGTAQVTITDSDLAPPPPPQEQTQTCADGSIIPVSQTCPAPPPPTIPQQVDIPSPTLNGASALATHDINTDLQVSAGGTGAIPPDAGVDPLGAYRQICGDGFLRKMDPILYPGQAVAGHLHDFSGDKGVNENSTVASLLDTADSTCNNNATGQASQNSVYWITALFDGQGNVVRPDFNSVYYKRRPSTNPDCGDPATGKIGFCIPFPNGLRMISGSLLEAGKFGPKNYRTDGGRYVYFNCYGTGAVSGRYANLAQAYAASPVCPNLQIVIEFPDCWDGQYLWKVDRSHVVYATYDDYGRFRCPVTNPYKITTVTIHYEYRGDVNWPTYALSADPMDPTQPRGWSLHADAWLVWDERVKQEFHTGCIQQHLNCSGGDLGTGRQLKGAAQPSYGFSNPTRITPISSLPVADRP